MELDKDIVNLAKAVRHVESGDNFNARGKSGEYGGYQYTKPTWQEDSRKYLGREVDLELATPQEQNEVVYKKYKELKDKGYNIGQIASVHNAGAGRPNAYKEGHTGTNKYGVSYNTPAYAEKVAKYYQQLKGGTPTSNIPLTPQPKKEETLGQELLGRTQQGTEAVKEGLAGKQNFFSGLLQAGGQVAGAVGDLTTKAIGAVTPDFIEKPVTGLIEKGVTKLAQTETGQKIGGAISKFSAEHPEASANIGAIVNIASAIPILKGIGVAKNLALDAGALALRKQAEKVAIRDFTEVASKTIGGRKALAKDPQVMETLIKERAIPDISDGKYSVEEARAKLASQIKNIDDTKLQPELDKAVSQQGVTTSFYPMATVEQKALQIAKDELKDSGPIKSYFERLRAKYGENPNIAQLNKAKRTVSKNITEAGFNSPTYSTDKIVRSALQESVEEGAKALGLQDVALINQEMASLIKAQNMLKYLDNKPVKTGIVGETIKNTATVGGEMVAGSVGVPIAGAVAGRQAGGFVGKKLSGSGITQGILNRTGKDAQRVSREELKKKMKGLFGGLAAQESTNQKKDNRPR